jgi:hypothetical protein
MPGTLLILMGFILLAQRRALTTHPYERGNYTFSLPASMREFANWHNFD